MIRVELCRSRATARDLPHRKLKQHLVQQVDDTCVGHSGQLTDNRDAVAGFNIGLDFERVEVGSVVFRTTRNSLPRLFSSRSVQQACSFPGADRCVGHHNEADGGVFLDHLACADFGRLLERDFLFQPGVRTMRPEASSKPWAHRVANTVDEPHPDRQPFTKADGWLIGDEGWVVITVRPAPLWGSSS